MTKAQYIKAMDTLLRKAAEAGYHHTVFNLNGWNVNWDIEAEHWYGMKGKRTTPAFHEGAELVRYILINTEGRNQG